MKKNLNNKGFTLIELLAVIVIMGVLMMVAIPAVTKYIEKSKKDTFIDTTKAYINAARYSLLNDEFSCNLPGEGSTSIIIPLNIVDIDQGGGKSSYGKDLKVGAIANLAATSSNSYIVVSYNSTTKKNEYAIAILDGANGIQTPLKEASLNSNSIVKGGVTSLTAQTTGTICTRIS